MTMEYSRKYSRKWADTEDWLDDEIEEERIWAH